MSKTIRAKVRSQQAYNAEKIGNKPGLPPRVGKSLHSFLLLNKVNANCGCKTYPDIIAPTIVSAEIYEDGGTNKGIIVTFSENLFANTLSVEYFKITHTNADNPAVTATDKAPTAATIIDGKLRLELADMGYEVVVLKYTPVEGSAKNLKDNNGNEVVKTGTNGHSFGKVEASS